MIQKKLVKNWNSRYPIGTKVKVYMDVGLVEETKTRSLATLLGGHSAVIWLEKITGCYSLSKIEPIL